MSRVEFVKLATGEEAFQWNPERTPNWIAVPPAALWFMEAIVTKAVRTNKDGSCTIRIPGGDSRAEPGDWIVLVEPGVLIARSPEAFAHVYGHPPRARGAQ